MSLNIRQLRHVLAVADHGGFGAGAKQLGLSQPALSRSIKTIEATLGAALFERTSRGAELTGVGQLLVEQGRAVLDQMNQLERDLGLSVKLHHGPLRIGAGPAPSTISVGTAVGHFSTEIPAVPVDLRVGDWRFLRQLVRERQLDLAICELQGLEDDSALVTEPLPAHKGVFVVREGHPIMDLELIDVASLQSYPLVCCSIPERLELTQPVVRVDTHDLILSVASESDCVGLSVGQQVAGELVRQRLVELPIEIESMVTNYGFVRLAKVPPSPAMLAFMEIVRRIEADLAASP